MKEDINNGSQVSENKKRKFSKNYLPAILTVLIILLATTSVYFYQKSKKDPNTVSQAEITSLVERAGKLVLLPEGETPTVATVSDPEALKGQAFFADAKKGDKVLIYSNAKKAFLYDPDADKVINIAPLTSEVSSQ